MSGKADEMMAFWSARVREFRDDPRSNTNDVWLREVEIAHVNGVIEEGRPRQVLDFGCANGFTTRRLAEMHPDVTFLGVDLNQEMVAAARNASVGETGRNLGFLTLDVLAAELPQDYDLIVAIRVFQNMPSLETQTRVFDRLVERLRPGGELLCVESYLAGYVRMNADRQRMSLPPLPIHPHLTLLTEAFDNHAASNLILVRREHLSSTYYLVTRLLYSYLAKMQGEAIDYNHPIHQIAAVLPNIGDYGPQAATLYRKPGTRGSTA
jgi:SAM-dependent methyltransferase